MKKLLTLGIVLSSLSMADVIGGEINIGFYNHAPSGTATYEGDTVDIEDDLKWSDESDVFFKAYLEHPLPILPNIKVGYTSFSHEGSGTVQESFIWGGTTFTANDNVDSSFDMDMYDITFYYEILDNWLNADIGLNVKYIDGTIDVASTLQDESTDFTLPIPMLYAKARVDLPTTDLSFQVEGNYVTYDGHTLYDFEAGVRYGLMMGFGVEAGYKTMQLTIDDIDDTSLDADFSGLYGKVVWDF